MPRAPKYLPAKGRKRYKVNAKPKPKDVPWREDPPRTKGTGDTQAGLVAAAAGESKADAVGRPPGMGNQYGNAAFRSIFRPHLLSKETVDLTYKRIKKSAAFHLEMLQMCFSKPVGTRQEEGTPVNVNLYLGGAKGPKLNLGYGNGGGNGHAIEVKALPSSKADTTAPSKDEPVVPTNGKNGNGHGGTS